MKVTNPIENSTVRLTSVGLAQIVSSTPVLSTPGIVFQYFYVSRCQYFYGILGSVVQTKLDRYIDR